MTPTIDLESLTLARGNHGSPEAGMCVMEAVAYVAREPFSDHPACASVVLGNFLRSWNDAMNDEDRQKLKLFIPRLAGSAASDAIERQREWMLLDWWCRVSAPTWLRAAGLVDAAQAVEATAPIVDTKSARAAEAALDRASGAAWDAWAAAWDAAAAWTAAGDAAAARAAARAAAWTAAGDAAGDAARAVAWATAKAALRPTVVTLQKSALELVERMIEAGEVNV